jgi:pyruvyltransferase
MKSKLKLLIYFISVLFSNRPKVFWWSMIKNGSSKKENFGDILTPYIINKISGIKPINFDPSRGYSKYIKHSIMVGSIINKSNVNTIVWGSGIISSDQIIKGGNFLAVRGPRTYKRLQELGFKPNKIFGDPGILMSSLYQPKKIIKKYKFGIIPHYVDFKEIKNIYKDKSDFKIIKLLIDKNKIEVTIDQINECEQIISSSLHGLILADTYQIPNSWLKFSDKLSGDDVKFYDYFESVGRLESYNTSIYEIIKNKSLNMANFEILSLLKNNLLKAYPYKIKKKYACR